MRKQHILYIVAITISLSLIITIDNNSYINSNNNVSALDYSSNVGIGFTFNPTLSVSISPSDLIVDNLIPGNTLDSNSINVSVATNAAYGYTLSADVNDENLVHSNSNNINTFSSIAMDADLPSLTTDNTWGYNTSLDSGSTWSNYNGLSSSSNAILLDNNGAADSAGSIDFKIAAKAGNAQPSGEYTGTINFIAITKPTPMNLAESYFAHGKTRHNGYYTMQDMTTEICNDTEVIGEGSQTQLIDIRDDKVYWATKLADGKCWMTQNLDLDIGGAGVAALTSENTDLSTIDSGSDIYDTSYGYAKNDDVWTWTPDTKAITSNHIISNISVPDWPNSNTVPYSAEAGDAYYYTSGTTDPETKTTLAECMANGHTEAECTHYHAGNYYNWTAAIASNNSNGFSANFGQASNSICPKGWRLPVASNSNQSVFEFGDLLYTYYHLTTVKYNTSNISNKIPYANSDSLNKIRTAPLWFVRSGAITTNSLGNPGAYGYYWSGTAGGFQAYDLSIYNDGIRPAHGNNRYYGFPIRCLAR